MIFVTVGTHPDQFDRLIRKIDTIAPKIKEKIVIQRGFTKYQPKNCEYFDFCPNLDEYFKKARLVISHSATSILESSIKYKKPLITVPRQAKYREHINDHQVEFAVYFARKTGIMAILNVKEITPYLLKNYKKIPKIDPSELGRLQDYFKSLFEKILRELK